MDLGEVWKNSQSGVGDSPVMCRLNTKCYYVHSATSEQQALCAVSHSDKIRQYNIHCVGRDKNEQVRSFQENSESSSGG